MTNGLDQVQHYQTPLFDAKLIAHRLGIEWNVMDFICVKIWGNSVESLTIYDLLAVWHQAEFENIALPEMSRIFEEVFLFFSPQERATIARLKMMVVTEIATMILGRTSESGRVCSWFRKNIESIIPGGELVEVKAIKKKRPDFLVKQEEIVYPVECKLCFDDKAVRQLQGYMKLWQVEKGYAVAPEKVCSIPDSIVFIQCP